MAVKGSFGIQNSSSDTVLDRCFPLLRKYLNCGAVIPYLVKYELITNRERETLMLLTLTNSDRVDLIFQWLPSKPDFMNKFLACLKESAKEEAVPGHEEIARQLEKEISKTLPDSGGGGKAVSRITGSGPATVTVQGRPGQDSMSNDNGEDCTSNDAEHRQSRSWRKCLMWCVFPLAIAAIALVLLIVLATTPTVNNDVMPSDLTNNNTVEINFSVDNRWLSQATLSTVGSCNGPLFIVQTPCVNLMKKYTYNYTIGGDIVGPDFVYLLPGSRIYFTLSAGANNDVWLFLDSETANDYLSNRYGCNNRPSDVKGFCFKSRDHNGTYQFNVTKAAYYFIRCYVGGGYCYKEGITWSFVRVSYNFEELSHDFRPEVNISSFLGRVIHLNKPFHFSKSCMLLHITALSCGSPGHHLQATEVKRRQDILLFPGLLLALSLIALAVCIHFVCVYRQKGGTWVALKEHVVNGYDLVR